MSTQKHYKLLKSIKHKVFNTLKLQTKQNDARIMELYWTSVKEMLQFLSDVGVRFFLKNRAIKTDGLVSAI